MTSNIRVVRAGQRLQRRMFLTALGLGLAVPAALKLSRNALAAPSGRPKRFMLFFYPHGVPCEHYNPVVMANDPTNFTLINAGVPTLGPLETYKSKVNVLQGFNVPGTLGTHDTIVSFLSGATPPSADDLTPRTTVEHAIANGLGVKPLILGACPYPSNANEAKTHVMWDGQPVVPEKNPVKAYDALFGNLTGGPPMPDPNAQLNDALVDLTSGEISALQAQLTGLTSETSKLQTHLDAMQGLKSTSGGMSTGTVSCTMAPSIMEVDTLRAASAGKPDDFFLDWSNFETIYKAQLKVAANALLCNAAQVVAIQPMWGVCNIDFGFMGSAGSHHDQLSHSSPADGGMAGLSLTARVPFAKAQQWLFQQLVDNVITLLDQPDPLDPTNHVIDNTIIYACSEIGDAADHSTETKLVARGQYGTTAYLPMVTIGGGGGALKTQQVLHYTPDRPMGDVYLALCKAMGVTGASFGSASTPVSEILVPGT